MNDVYDGIKPNNKIALTNKQIQILIMKEEEEEKFKEKFYWYELLAHIYDERFLSVILCPHSILMYRDCFAKQNKMHK